MFKALPLERPEIILALIPIVIVFWLFIARKDRIRVGPFFPIFDYVKSALPRPPVLRNSGAWLELVFVVLCVAIIARPFYTLVRTVEHKRGFYFSAMLDYSGSMTNYFGVLTELLGFFMDDRERLLSEAKAEGKEGLGDVFSVGVFSTQARVSPFGVKKNQLKDFSPEAIQKLESQFGRDIGGGTEGGLAFFAVFRNIVRKAKLMDDDTIREAAISLRANKKYFVADNLKCSADGHVLLFFSDALFGDSFFQSTGVVNLLADLCVRVFLIEIDSRGVDVGLREAVDRSGGKVISVSGDVAEFRTKVPFIRDEINSHIPPQIKQKVRFERKYRMSWFEYSAIGAIVFSSILPRLWRRFRSL